MTLQRIKKIVYRHCCKMPQYYVLIMSVVLLAFVCTPPAFAVDDIWTVGRSIITDVYQKIVGISKMCIRDRDDSDNEV